MPETVLLKKKRKKKSNPEDKVVVLLDTDKDKQLYEYIKTNIAPIMKTTYLGMTPYQIRNFVLNKKEFPTNWSKLQQAKLELYIRFKNMILLYFDYLEAEAKTRMYKEIINQLDSNPVDKAKKDLYKVKVMREQFKMAEIKKVANDKLQESKPFLETYLELKHLDELPEKNKERMIEETWKKKAMMMPEIFADRYGEEYIKKILGHNSNI